MLSSRGCLSIPIPTRISEAAATCRAVSTQRNNACVLHGWHPNLSTRLLCYTAGNHEEESEIQFGDDITQITGCSFPGSDGSTPDCARAFVCAPYPAFGLASATLVLQSVRPLFALSQGVCAGKSRLHFPRGNVGVVSSTNKLSVHCSSVTYDLHEWVSAIAPQLWCETLWLKTKAEAAH